MSVSTSDLTHLKVTVDDAVVIISLDVPGRSMNVVDEALINELGTTFDVAIADDSVKGIVLTSNKPGSFGGGADLDSLPELAADPGTEDFLVRTHDLMIRMSESTKPVIAAIDGYALGGALELALACSSIIVSERALLGLPESTLGLVPGGAGTQMLLRWVEPAQAIELLVSGRTLDSTSAVELGLADEIVAVEDLVDRATQVATTRGTTTTRHPIVNQSQLEQVLAAGRAVRRPVSNAATDALLNVMGIGLLEGRGAGLAAERAAFLRLLRSEQSAALIHMFHVEAQAKRAFGVTGEPVKKIGVVGAGQMGAGIAATSVSHGTPAVIRDIDEERLAEAKTRAEKATTKRGRKLAATDWTSTTSWEGFDQADAVVEAVFELPELKRETLAMVDQTVGAAALIATNTSAIPVESLAGSVSHPERFLGTHFFSPVEMMPLVELVPHERTAPDTVARAGSFARSLGKLPVVVADKPGFFTSRVYARWLIEALRLLLDGADPAQIDDEARTVGFPVGPLLAHDEVTLQLVRQASIAQVADQVLTERVDVNVVKALLSRLIDAGIEGKRFGRGFYDYVDGRRSGHNPDVPAIIDARGKGVPAGQAGERLLLAFASECFLCWDDGTLCHPDDGDLAAVLGIGFPRVLGGPFHWADSHGPATVLARCEALGTTAFAVGESLPRIAAAGATFAAESRRARPGQP